MTPAFIGNLRLRRSIRLDPSYLTVVLIVLAMHRLPAWTAAPLAARERGSRSGRC